MENLLGAPVLTLQGDQTTFGQLAAGRTVLVVNVASRCGLTPQYAQLEALHEELADRGFSVIGFPCNQFGGQEPGSEQEIAEFCSATFGVSFPLSAKIDVNGAQRDPVYQRLAGTADAGGYSGDIRWNFEKFVVSPTGEVTARFEPKTQPDAPEVRAAIEAVLPRS